MRGKESRALPFGLMEKAKAALVAAARYIQQNPRILLEVAMNATGMKVTVPLSVLRYFGEKLGESKKGPKDIVVEAVPPGLRVSATVNAMGTGLRVGATLSINEVNLDEQEFKMDVQLTNVVLRVAGESDSPVAALIKSGALDLSRPGNLAKYLPNRPKFIVEANGDHLVLDLMREPKITENPNVSKILGLLVPVLGLKSIGTEGDALVIALTPKPEGFPKVIQAVKNLRKSPLRKQRKDERTKTTKARVAVAGERDPLTSGCRSPRRRPRHTSRRRWWGR